MTRPTGDESDRTGRSTEEATSRRRLLRSGTAVALSLASAGCLSNPWSPGATARTTATGGGDATATTTARTATDGRDTTASGDGTTADATTTEPATTTGPPAAEREPDLVVEVAPDGFMFAPETFEVAVGDTVHWEWKDGGHNVRVKTKPDGSDWTGTPGSATDTYGEGYLHAHTFQVGGEYEYYCAPHRSLGLRGSFTVR